MVEDVDSNVQNKISHETSSIVSEDPVDILRKRLAYGEISVAEFRKLMSAMEVLN